MPHDPCLCKETPQGPSSREAGEHSLPGTLLHSQQGAGAALPLSPTETIWAKREKKEPRAWKLWWCHNIELAISDLPPTQLCHTFNSNKEIDVKSVGLFILKVGQRLRVLKAHKTRHSINKNKFKNPQNIPVSTGVPSLCCTTHSHHHSYCSGYHFAWSHAHTFKDLSEQTWYPYNPIPFSARGWQKPCP